MTEAAPDSSKGLVGKVAVSVIVAVLGASGLAVGKGAHNDMVTAQADMMAALSAANVQAARTETALTALSGRLRDHESHPHRGAIEMGAKIGARVNALEIQAAACPCEQLKTRRRR